MRFRSLGQLWASIAGRLGTRTFPIDVSYATLDDVVFRTGRRLNQGDYVEFLFDERFRKRGIVKFGRNGQYSAKLDAPFRRGDNPAYLVGRSTARLIDA